MIPLAEIRAAARTIAGEAIVTPVLTSGRLDRIAGATVVAKDESRQRAGAFKFRGAYNRLAAITPQDRTRGVVAVSSGNHGAAVACAADIFGIDATIHVPDDVASAKRALIEQYGGHVVLFDRHQPVREAGALAQVAETGATFVHPFEDPLVMRGQGTVALEMFEQVGRLDVLVVPMSGGGLMAGCASAMTQLDAGCELIGVEPENADDTRQSFAAGAPVRIDRPDTIADGLAVTAPGDATFAITHRLVDDVVTVTDRHLVETMALALDVFDTQLEPSGAAALAAVIAHRERFAGRRVGVVLSGGNIDDARFAQLVNSVR